MAISQKPDNFVQTLFIKRQNHIWSNLKTALWPLLFVDCLTFAKHKKDLKVFISFCAFLPSRIIYWLDPSQTGSGFFLSHPNAVHYLHHFIAKNIFFTVGKNKVPCLLNGKKKSSYWNWPHFPEKKPWEFNICCRAFLVACCPHLK